MWKIFFLIGLYYLESISAENTIEEATSLSLTTYGNVEGLLGQGTEAFIFSLKGQPDQPSMVMRMTLTSNDRREIDPGVLLHLLQETVVTESASNKQVIMKEVTDLLASNSEKLSKKRIAKEANFESAVDDVKKVASVPTTILERDIPLFETSLEISNDISASFPLIVHMGFNKKYDGAVGKITDDHVVIPEYSVLKLFYGWYHDQHAFLTHVGALHSDPHMFNLLYKMEPNGVPTFAWTDFAFDRKHHWMGAAGTLEMYETLLFGFCKHALPQESKIQIF